jgi:endoglucanase
MSLQRQGRAAALASRFSIVALLLAMAAVAVPLAAASAGGPKLKRTVTWPSTASSTSTTTSTTTTPTTTPPTTTPPTTTPPSTAPPGSSTVQLEGQQLNGSWTQVADPGATGGTAVQIQSGALWATTSFPAGSYLLSVRVRSAGERIVLGINSQQVATASVSGGWQTVSAPVHLNGTTSWGVMPLGPIGGQPQQPVYVDWMALTPTAATYTTLGNKIFDPSGAQFTPRGVNQAGLELAPTYPNFQDFNFYAMSLWGATIVRIPLSQSFWLSTDCSYDSGYAARIDQIVQSITTRGMVALLDLHTSHAGALCGPIVHPPMADDHSVQFWTQVANRYKSNPLVAFDLVNEPAYIDGKTWRDGGTVTTWHAVGMQQLYNTVRATGATNLVFLSGLGWAYHVDVALQYPVDGYGIVYSTHLYSQQGTTGLPTGIDAALLPTAAQYPVVAGEFGTQLTSPTYNSSVIAYAESHGLGWIAFNWNVGPYPQNYALLDSFSTYQPSTAGVPVRDGLWKAKGWTNYGGYP